MMIKTTGETGNIVREVVGVFDSTAHLEDAVERMGVAGIDRADISVLGVDRQHPSHRTNTADHVTARSVLDISDDPNTPTTAFVSGGSRGDARGVASAVPLLIGGMGAAWAVAASGGALLFAVGATVASGAVGAGLGALLYNAIDQRYETSISHQLAQGGLILWVRVADSAIEEKALAILRACGAGSVHTHMIDRPWGVAASPLHGVQPDPFLEQDHSPDTV